MKKDVKCSVGIMKFTVVMICAFLFFMGHKTTGLADFTGTVKTNAKVRQSADVNSEAVSGLTQGATVTIIGEVTDASGTVWYQVSDGYVRSDLIDKTESTDGGAATTTATSASEPAGATASGAEEGPETAMDLQYATVKASKARIRSKASTSAATVDSMPQNTTLIISGQTTGSDGKTWYYVTFTGTSGTEKTGFVRSDLINLGEMVPVEPEQPVEEPEAPVEEPAVDEPAVTPDYEVVYEDPKNEGNFAWYLHDNTGEKPTRQNLEVLIQAAYSASANAEADAATISKQRIVIVIMVALVIILAVVLTFMFFKLRDAYIGDDEEDENYNWKADKSSRDNRENRDGRENRENRPVRENREGRSVNRSSAGRDEEPVRRKSAPREGQQQAPVRKRPVEQERKAPAKEVTYEDDGTSHPKPAPKKKAKNFLADDDDFEFEFLNMKDKDKDNE